MKTDSRPERIMQLADSLRDKDLDGMIVTNLKNVRYLTGFSGSAGLLAFNARNGRVTLLTDSRYDIQSKQETKDINVIVEVEVVHPRRVFEIIFDKILNDCKTLAVEGDQLQINTFERIRKISNKKKLISTSQVIEKLRVTKHDDELESLFKAANIADKAFEAIKRYLKSGISELELARRLDNAMRKFGSSGPSFPTIVASGKNGAIPHHQPTGREIKKGELVTFDFGSTYNGYASDMTRTVAIGKVKSSELKEVYEAVMESQNLGVKAVYQGNTTSKVDWTCRNALRKKGYGQYFTHATGHGVGLDVHELPYVARLLPSTLVKGMVITVEPGVYIEGLGGVRIEDTVVVTDNGCEKLTKTEIESI